MSNLKLCERERIEFYLRCKQGIREVARLVHRDHSVISREVRRNGGISGYDAKRAQAQANKRLAHNIKRKLDKDVVLKQYVIEQLKEEWSPKVVAGRLKKYPPPELKGKRISHESIYQYWLILQQNQPKLNTIIAKKTSNFDSNPQSYPQFV